MQKNRKDKGTPIGSDGSGVPGGSPIGDWSNGSQTVATSGSGTTVGSLDKSAITYSSVGKTSNMGGSKSGQRYSNRRAAGGAGSPTGYGYIFKKRDKKDEED